MSPYYASLNSTFPLLLDLLLKSVIVLAVAFAIIACWRGASAAYRHLVWGAAFGVLLLLPLSRFHTPQWSWQPAMKVSTVNMMDAVTPIETVTLVMIEKRGTIPVGASAVHAKAMPAWRDLLMIFWLAGVAVLILHRVAVSVRLWRLKRQSRMLTDERVLLLAAKVTDGWKSRQIVFRQSAECVVPLTWGIWRPVVLMPAALETWSEERLIAALQHEVSHVRRGDCLTRLAVYWLCALYWMNPLVWLAARELRLAQEQACDDLVLRAGVGGKEYAKLLCDIVQSLKTARQYQTDAVMMAQPSTLAQRVRSIVDIRRDRRPVCVWMKAVAAVVIAVALVGAALAQVKEEDKSDRKIGQASKDVQSESSSQPVPAANQNLATNSYQVEIEARIIKIDQADLEKLDIQWQLDGFQGKSTTAPVSDASGMRQCVLTGSKMNAVINALSKAKSVDTLFAPKMTTRDGKLAQMGNMTNFIYPTEYKVFKGGDGAIPSYYPIAEYKSFWGGDGYVTLTNFLEKIAEYKSVGGGDGDNGTTNAIPCYYPTGWYVREVGVIISVTPHVETHVNAMALQLAFEVSELVGMTDYSSGKITPIGDFGTSNLAFSFNSKSSRMKRWLPVFESLSANMAVRILDGQTVVLRGMAEVSAPKVDNKIPFLGDIPFIGRLFRSTVERRTKRNFLTFVTARLVDPDGNPIHKSEALGTSSTR